MSVLLMTYSRDYSQAMAPETCDVRSDEAACIASAQSGDSGAFERLYRANVDKVHALCLRMTGNVSEAEDCVQEAFIQAWNKLHLFRGDSAFATWMHRIAVNAVLGRMRKSRRERDRLLTVVETSAPTVPTGDSGELRDLSNAVNALPEGARHVFVLYAIYGYSHEEASNMLGIAVGTSKAQFHRARRLLATRLKKDGFEE